MKLVGQTVSHPEFGDGTVTALEKNIVTVSFADAEKKFLYPDAFDKFLTMKNDTLKDKVQAMEEEIEHKSLLLNMRISSKSQVAFDVTDEQDPFSSWSISTGTYLSGYAKGEVRIPDRLKPNSMCLMTHLDAGKPESERTILGAFMVKDDFLGAYCHDGVIPAHPNYRMQLKKDKQLLFWDYFTDDTSKQRWGRISMKYFSNKAGEAILYDIANNAEPEDRKSARQFYYYFCKINRLDSRKLKTHSDEEENK